MTKLSQTLKDAMECADGDPSEAVFFWCKDGGTRSITMTHIDDACEGCDCGLGQLDALLPEP